MNKNVMINNLIIYQISHHQHQLNQIENDVNYQYGIVIIIVITIKTIIIKEKSVKLEKEIIEIIIIIIIKKDIIKVTVIL